MMTLTIGNEEGRILSQHLRENVHAEDETKNYRYPIVFEGEIFGQVFFQWNTTPTHQQIDHRVDQAQIFVSTILIILISLVISLIFWLVIHPIRRIFGYLSPLSDHSPSEPLHIPFSVASLPFLLFLRLISQP